MNRGHKSIGTGRIAGNASTVRAFPRAGIGHGGRTGAGGEARDVPGSDACLAGESLFGGRLVAAEHAEAVGVAGEVLVGVVG